MDNKATVPIGEPFNTISTGVCGHNKSLGTVDGCIRALDHDWKLCGLIPSVSLLCDIPESTKHTFFLWSSVFDHKKKKYLNHLIAIVIQLSY